MLLINVSLKKKFVQTDNIAIEKIYRLISNSGIVKNDNNIQKCLLINRFGCILDDIVERGCYIITIYCVS